MVEEVSTELVVVITDWGLGGVSEVQLYINGVYLDSKKVEGANQAA